MSKKFSKIRSKIQLTRSFLIGLIIIAFIGFIIFSSIGGSQTNPFNYREGQPEFEDNPNSIDAPGSDRDGFNLSDFGEPPEGLNPPADLVGDSGNIGSPDAPNFNPPENPDQPGELPDFPDQDNPRGPDQPGSPGGGFEFPDQPRGDNPQNPNVGNTNRSGNPIELPDRPNKAANMWNLSNIELFPETNNSISISINFPTLPLPGFNNITFFLIIVSIFYLPNAVIRRLLAEVSEMEENMEGTDPHGMFFKPEKTEAEKRREEKRKNMLLNLGEHVNFLIEDIQQFLDEGKSPKEIITWTYLELDEAFSNFMTLRRDKDLTPLEHAKLSFESHEIDNESLTSIVDLFYRTRFGNKDLGKDKVEELIDHLTSLVVNDFGMNNKNKSKWSIF